MITRLYKEVCIGVGVGIWYICIFYCIWFPSARGGIIFGGVSVAAGVLRRAAMIPGWLFEVRGEVMREWVEVGWGGGGWVYGAVVVLGRWHKGYSSSEKSESELHCSEAVLGVVGARGWRRAITPARRFLIAQLSGVRPLLSGLLGLTSSRSRSIFTTPSHPFQAAK